MIIDLKPLKYMLHLAICNTESVSLRENARCFLFALLLCNSGKLRAALSSQQLNQCIRTQRVQRVSSGKGSTL